MTTAPKIGSYRKPSAQNEPNQEDVNLEFVDKRPKIETPAKSLSEGVQEELKEGIDRTKNIVEKARTYEEILSDHGIKIAEAHAVVDSLLEKGFYEETVSITQTIKATFRTRVHADYIRYLRAVEIYNPKYVDEQQEIQLRYYLAASIVAFKGKTFSQKPDVSVETFFEEKLQWVESQPETVIRLLAQKLAKFDLKIQAIMSEGVIENF